MLFSHEQWWLFRANSIKFYFVFVKMELRQYWKILEITNDGLSNEQQKVTKRFTTKHNNLWPLVIGAEWSTLIIRRVVHGRLLALNAAKMNHRTNNRPKWDSLAPNFAQNGAWAVAEWNCAATWGKTGLNKHRSGKKVTKSILHYFPIMRWGQLKA